MQTCGCITAENEVKGLNHTAPSPLLKLGLSCSECFTQCVQLLNITGPEWIHTHTLSSDLFTTSLNYTTHTEILCQMFRSEEFLLLWNVGHSGK